MVLTPTYYVFRMFRPHQEATMLPVELETPDYTYEKTKIPAVTAAASRDERGVLHVSLTNADPHHAVAIDCQLNGVDAGRADQWKVGGEILTADRMSAYNDFGKSAEVKPAAFDGAKVHDGSLAIELPAKSVVMLTIENVAATAVDHPSESK
jgi:alpha-N-arabinofuranosidase